MTLEVKITQEDLILYEILKHPVLCGEFINNVDKLPMEEKFEFTEYQKEMLCDFGNFVSLCCARSVGKTVVLSNEIIWVLVNNIFPDDYIVYHVPGKNHVEPVFTNLEKMFRGNSVLKHFLPRKSGINHSDLIIKCLNGASLLCRIAGQSNTGTPVVGLHSPFELVDEAGYYPYGTWTELNPTLNRFTAGHRLTISGVPTGIREDNVLFMADQENSDYTKHRISALQNPRFTKEDDEAAALLYGGRDSDDYIHLVLGQHGKPVFSLFDRAAMSIGNYPVYKLVLDGIRLQNDMAAYYERISAFPGVHDKSVEYMMGIDLGYTEPTAIYILYEDKHGTIKFHGKIRLNKIQYYIQEKIIDWLDSKFEPTLIGVDEGSAGKSVVPRLREHVDYLHKEYDKRLVPINFSSMMVIGIDSAGDEIKGKTKPMAVGVLQQYTNNHRIQYTSTDLETIIELERMTYTKTPSGDIVYRTLTDRGGKRGEDHFTAALLCFTLAHYMYRETLDLRKVTKKLFKPRWSL